MSALLDIESSAIPPSFLPNLTRMMIPEYAPTILSPALRLPYPGVESPSLRISVPDLSFAIEGTVAQLEHDAGQLFIRATIDTNVEASLSFAGRMMQHGATFQIEEALVRLAPTQDCARADFVASTLNAALSLWRKVQFQMPGTDLTLGFDLPLIEISKLLQSRQTSYRLMVIERATGLRFDLPPNGFSGTEIAAIVFVFRAIVDRTFKYHLINGIPITVGANEEGARRLRSLQEFGVITFGPEEMSRRVLGIEMPLGPMTVTIQDLRIEDVDRVSDEVALHDGHPVTVLVRSGTNKALFALPEAPRLPSNPWDSRLQSLIDLEGELDSRLIERYHALAAGSLAGLTDEEKKRVTTRPQLNKPSLLTLLKEKLGI